MPTFGLGEAQSLATLDVNLAKVLLDGRELKRVVLHGFAVLTTVENVGIHINHSAAAPLVGIGLALVEIEIPIAVAHIGRVDETVGVVVDEIQRI